MAWFKIDDSFHSHPKVIVTSLSALGLWTAAGAWSSNHLTDGFIADAVLPQLSRGDADLAKELVDNGLWKRARGGFQFHDWQEFQPHSEKVKADRKATAERQKRWREGRRNAASNGVSNGVTNASPPSDRNASPSRPDPTRPDPKDKDKGVARKRASRIPENFTISADMRTWAAEKATGFNLDAEHENFVDYWTAKAGKDATKVDWVATWRTWMRRQASQPQQRRPTGSTSDQRVMQAQALKQQMRLAEAPQIGGAA